MRKIAGGSVETLEFIVEKDSAFANKQIKDIEIAEDTIIATIVRKHAVVIPHGDYRMNYAMLLKNLGILLVREGLSMFPSLIVVLIYGESSGKPGS